MLTIVKVKSHHWEVRTLCCGEFRLLCKTRSFKAAYAAVQKIG